MYCKLRNILSYEAWCNYNAPFSKNKHLHRDDSNGSKSLYGPMLHFHTWMPYSFGPKEIYHA
jgi:hypothetical protein